MFTVNSLVNLVFTTLTENSTASRLQESLFTILGVCNFISKLLGIARHFGLFARVSLMLTNHDTLAGEVKLNIVQVLVLVQTDLDSTIASADALHVVLFEGD